MSTGQSIHAMPSITPSPREGIDQHRGLQPDAALALRVGLRLDGHVADRKRRADRLVGGGRDGDADHDRRDFRTPATPSWLGRTIVIVRGTPKRPAAKPNYPRLAYSGPPITADTDAARAAAIIERSRCPELTRTDLLLVAK